MLCDTES